MAERASTASVHDDLARRPPGSARSGFDEEAAQALSESRAAGAARRWPRRYRSCGAREVMGAPSRSSREMASSPSLGAASQKGIQTAKRSHVMSIGL
jgi:hypothetical protein